MLELRDGCSFPRLLVGVTVVLALVDAIIAVLAFYQVCSPPVDLGFIFLSLRLQEKMWIGNVLTSGA